MTRSSGFSFEGAGKQALEIGRNRLLVAGSVIAFAFVAVAVRLVDIAVTVTWNRQPVPVVLATRVYRPGTDASP